jgi:hypothetical protein
MASTHRGTNTTKGKAAQNLSKVNWDDVWSSLSEKNIVRNLKDWNAEGWLSVNQACKVLKMSHVSAGRLKKHPDYESRKERVFSDGFTRHMWLVRPRVS